MDIIKVSDEVGWDGGLGFVVGLVPIVHLADYDRAVTIDSNNYTDVAICASSGLKNCSNLRVMIH